MSFCFFWDDLTEERSVRHINTWSFNKLRPGRVMIVQQKTGRPVPRSHCKKTGNLRACLLGQARQLPRKERAAGQRRSTRSANS